MLADRCTVEFLRLSDKLLSIFKVYIKRNACNGVSLISILFLSIQIHVQLVNRKRILLVT